jgi:hypothetical protein
MPLAACPPVSSDMRGSAAIRRIEALIRPGERPPVEFRQLNTSG